jgi:hypothetical protein
VNGKDWVAIETLGPPPAGEHWFPAASWRCRKGHIEIAGLALPDNMTICNRCKWPLVKLKQAWIKGEPPLVVSKGQDHGPYNR